MKLLVNLFYILLSIFIVGIILCFISKNNDVLARIATGLITGSFVAGANTLVSYLYQRKNYIANLITSLESTGYALFDDLNTTANTEYFDILNYNDDSLLEQLPSIMRSIEKDSSEREVQYKQCYNKFDFDGFTPMLKFDSKFYDNLEEYYVDLEDLFEMELFPMPNLYKQCFDHKTLLPNSGTKTDVKRGIDKFRRSYKEYRGRKACVLADFVEICSPLCDLVKDKVSPNDYNDLEAFFHWLKSIAKGERLIDRFGGEYSYDQYIRELNETEEG